MQRVFYFFPVICFLLLVSVTKPIYAQDISAKIKFADSLFSAKKYTESFDIYRNVFEKNRKYSPGMLLKMAYIREGLGDYTGALYYLNIYYLHEKDEKALSKMEKLAEKHKLKGYAYTDAEYFFTIYRQYFPFFVGSLSFVVIALLLVVGYQKLKYKKRIIASAILTIVLLAGLFLLVNYDFKYKEAIVIKDNSYLMEGPSAGSPLVEIIQRGNKISVTGSDDIWLKVRWEGNRAFIRKSNIAIVEE